MSHKIAGDTDTQSIQRSWRGQIKRAVDVPQPYWVRHNNKNARHNQAYSYSVQKWLDIVANDSSILAAMNNINWSKL